MKEIENKTADAMPIEQGKIQDLFIYFFIFLSGATVFNPFVVIWNKTKSWFPLIFQSNFCFILFQKKKFRNMEKSNF